MVYLDMASLRNELKQALWELGVATKGDIPTKKDIKNIVLNTLKTQNVATRNDIPSERNIKEIVGDVFHEQITQYHNDMVIPEINKLQQKDDAIIDALKILKDAVDELKGVMSHLKSEIRNLKVDLTFLVTRKEFEKFKSQVLRN